MASQLTEYERRRLANIKRNREMMASLTIQSKLSEISSAKRQRAEKCKSYRIGPGKKDAKSNELSVITRSLRARELTSEFRKSPAKFPKPVQMRGNLQKEITQIPHTQQHTAPRPRGRPRKKITQPASTKQYTSPTEQHTAPRRRGRPRKHVLSDANAISETQGSPGPGFLESLVKLPERLPQVPGPLRFRDSYSVDSESDVKAFTKKILSISSSWSICEANGVRVQNKKASTQGISHSNSFNFEFGTLRLKPDHIARVVPKRLNVVKFFPTRDLEMVVAGNEFGHVGFWDMKSNDEVNCIHLYKLHSAPVSGILVHPFSMSKVYTSCHDGVLRVMNIDKQVFDLVHSSGGSIYSLAQKPDDVNSIYFGEAQEVVVKMWDERMGKTSASWNLHKKKINSIDFNPTNTNIMATSSTDGTACIWDLRKMSPEKSMMLKAIEHKKAVHSAYFSPSGIHLATKSTDGNIGVVSGKNFEDESMIHHDNSIRAETSYFRAIWGWDDEHLFVGNMLGGGVDILSVGQKTRIHTLRSKHLPLVTRWLDAHPWKAGALACGAAYGGQVCVWTPPS